MDIQNFLIEKLGKENVYIDEPMSKHTTFKTGGNADFFVKIKDKQKLIYVLNFCKENKVPTFILGNGSNILVKDKGIRGIVCKIELEKFEIKEDGENIFVTVGSGNKNAITAQKLLNLEIEGFEFASRNTSERCGGAIKMNAGAHGREMKDIVVSTEYIDEDGNIQNIGLEEHNFQYRKSIFSDKKYIILESTLKLKKGKKEEINAKMKEYFEFRKEKQPIDMPSRAEVLLKEEKILLLVNLLMNVD